MTDTRKDYSAEKFDMIMLGNLHELVMAKFRTSKGVDIGPLVLKEKAECVGYYYHRQTQKKTFPPKMYRSNFGAFFIILGCLDFSGKEDVLKEFIHNQFSSINQAYGCFQYFFGLGLGGALCMPVSWKRA